MRNPSISEISNRIGLVIKIIYIRENSRHRQETSPAGVAYVSSYG